MPDSMLDRCARSSIFPVVAATLLAATANSQEPAGDPGTALRSDQVSEGRITTLAEAMERDRKSPPPTTDPRLWNGQAGVWTVPTQRVKAPRRGERSAINRWGDPQMGIGLGGLSDVHSVFVGSFGGHPARSIEIVGYRGTEEIERTESTTLSTGGVVLELDFEGVDRLEFLAQGTESPFAFFAVDDLSFTRDETSAPQVVDFESVQPKTRLTGSGHSGLTWETGRGLDGVEPQDFGNIVPAPRQGGRPASGNTGSAGLPGDGPVAQSASLGSAPNVSAGFPAVTQGVEPGATLVPPDTCGAVGLDHFVAVVNANFSVYEKNTGNLVASSSLGAFFNTGAFVGDPRALFDEGSQRFFVLATDFGGTIFFAVSTTSDPTQSWFTFTFNTGGGFPDYPTLGVDARGAYVALADFSGQLNMTIFALDKAPLVASPQSVGRITSFNVSGFEGAIQPCQTYGDPGEQYLISTISSTQLRLRAIRPPLTAPQLVTVRDINVPSHANAPDAPALGSVPLTTIDDRLLNAVYRGGRVYTTHDVDVNGRAGVRWYEIDPASSTPTQVGTVADPVNSYFFGSIAVDAAGDIAIGFSGSNAQVYGSAYVTARRASDPAGETAPPILLRAGEGPFQIIDGAGRNRWGDYSMTTVDPTDDRGFWTIQEFAGAPSNTWRTTIARLGYETETYGSGVAGSFDTPALSLGGFPSPGTTIDLTLTNALGRPIAGVLLVGAAPDSLPALGGQILVRNPDTLDIPLQAVSTTIRIPIPADPSLIGNDVFLQGAHIDPRAPQGIALSAGLRLTFAAD